MLVGAITMIFTGITIIFLKQLCFGLWLTLPLLLSLASGITLLGYGVGRKEGECRIIHPADLEGRSSALSTSIIDQGSCYLFPKIHFVSRFWPL